jgi:hypothetical protein
MRSRCLNLMTAFMKNKEVIDAKTLLYKTICLWCDIPLGSNNSVEDCVCLKCYQLLINAGVPEQEIFNPNAKKQYFSNDGQRDFL